MDKVKNIKIILGIIYILIISLFLWVLFTYFSIDDFTSYKIIKSNTENLSIIKNSNIFLISILFFIFIILWVLLLGFASPVLLIGGFIFGKWTGTLIVTFGLTSGATLLYIFSNFLLKDLIKKKFSSKFLYLYDKFKKNEFLYFVIYRAVGGIPFFIQNLLPVMFDISKKNYFFGSLIGMSPQIFIGVSLGSGINKLIQNNDVVPSFSEMIFMPDIYIPILALISVFLIAYFSRNFFFKK